MKHLGVVILVLICVAAIVIIGYLVTKESDIDSAIKSNNTATSFIRKREVMEYGITVVEEDGYKLVQLTGTVINKDSQVSDETEIELFIPGENSNIKLNIGSPDIIIGILQVSGGTLPDKKEWKLLTVQELYGLLGVGNQISITLKGVYMDDLYASKNCVGVCQKIASEHKKYSPNNSTLLQNIEQNLKIPSEVYGAVSKIVIDSTQ